MTDARKNLRDTLEADARRRAKGEGRVAPAAEPAEHSAPWEARFRLVNTFPRQTRPLFAKLRETVAPYGYALSPLHPTHDLHRPRMQTELTRSGPDDPARYAPLVFELEPGAASMRVYVRQFGGRAAPDFPERSVDLGATPDLPALEAILQEYVVCMLEAPAAAVAA